MSYIYISIYVMGVGCRCGYCNSGSCRNTSRTFQESSDCWSLIILAACSHLPPYVICICWSIVVIGIGCRCGCCDAGSCRNTSGTFQESSDYWNFDHIGSLFTPATSCHMHMSEHCCYWCWMSLWMLRHWILPEHFRNLPGKFRLLEFSLYWWQLEPDVCICQSSVVVDDGCCCGYNNSGS